MLRITLAHPDAEVFKIEGLGFGECHIGIPLAGMQRRRKDCPHGEAEMKTALSIIGVILILASMGPLYTVYNGPGIVGRDDNPHGCRNALVGFGLFAAGGAL